MIFSEVSGPSFHPHASTPYISPSSPPPPLPPPKKKERKQQPTWRGGLVDYFISLSLRNYSVTYSQQSEELLYVYSCGLDRTP